MKSSIRAIVSGLAAFGTTAAQAMPFDETGANDLGNDFDNRTVLPRGTTSIIGAGDVDFFELAGLGSAAPFRFDLDGSCDDESSASVAGPGSSCAAVELGPVLMDVGASSFSGTFEYGFLGEAMFELSVGGSSEQSSEASEESGESTPVESGSEPTNGESGPAGSASEPMDSASEEQMQSSEEASVEPQIAATSTTASLGPVFSFYDEFGDMIVSFQLPELTPDAPAFRVAGQALGSGSVIGQVSWTGPYSLDLNAVPEPATGAIALAGLAAAGAARRRRPGQHE
ncbi:MAG: PEP-CTERM sorting domain-containing protein [Gammaproteobacteria bacterium]